MRITFGREYPPKEIQTGNTKLGAASKGKAQNQVRLNASVVLENQNHFYGEASIGVILFYYFSKLLSSPLRTVYVLFFKIRIPTGCVAP